MRTMAIILMVCSAAVAASAQGPVTSADPTTNAKTNTFSVKGKVITDFSTGVAPTWRFVHDGKVLILEPFYTGGTTYSPWKIVECKSFGIATNEIAKLNLKLTDDQKFKIEQLVAEQKEEEPAPK